MTACGQHIQEGLIGSESYALKLDTSYDINRKGMVLQGYGWWIFNQLDERKNILTLLKSTLEL